MPPDTVSRVEIDLAFRKYDQDGSGTISQAELCDLCAELGAPLEKDEIKSVIKKLDTDGSGAIDKSEFEQWWSGRADEVVGGKLGALAQKGRIENHCDIFSSCWNGDIDVTTEFLSIDPSLAKSIDESDFGEGNTPLHYSAYAGHIDIVLLLSKQYQANINARNQAGCTPLFLASQQGRREIVEFLLRSGARINITDKVHGYSPLEVAENDEIRALLTAGCDTSPPRVVEHAPTVECPKYGTLRILWSYRGVEQASTKSLAVSGFKLQVVRASADDTSPRDNGNFQVLREEYIAGSDKKETLLTSMNYPFPLKTRLAACNAAGQSDWGEFSESICTTHVPTVTSAPSVVPVGRAGLEISWKKAISNGCKVDAYKLDGCEYTIGVNENEFDWETMGVFPSKINETKLTGLQQGQAYVFRVVATNKMGKSFPGPRSQPVKTSGTKRR